MIPIHQLLREPEKLLSDRIQDRFYHESCFNKSLTFNQWVPISCSDIKRLDPFETLYQRPSPIKHSKGGPFFFRNHPINYVIISGWCISYEKKETEKERITYYVFGIDDGSGAEIEAYKFDQANILNYESCLGKFVEIKGQIEQKGTYDRTITIRDIGLRDSSLLDQMLLFEEVYLLRKQILSQSWILEEVDEECKELEEKELRVLEERRIKEGHNRKLKKNALSRITNKRYYDKYQFSDPAESEEPSTFCSLTRCPSILQPLPSFLQSINSESDNIPKSLKPKSRPAMNLSRVTGRTDTVLDEPFLEVADSLLDSSATSSHPTTKASTKEIGSKSDNEPKSLDDNISWSDSDHS